MSDRPSRLDGLAGLVDARWTEARADKVSAALGNRKRKRARSRRALLSLTVVLVLSVAGGLGWASLHKRVPPPALPRVEAPSPPETASPRVAAAGAIDPPVVVDPVVDPTTTAARDPLSGAAVRNAAPAAGAWRVQANDGDYDTAWRSLKAAGPSAVKDETADLLLASDVARLSGHAADAVDPLKRVLRDHANDARAPLAAFTLGRVLLDELGRPGEAAVAFARARSLAPGGPLEEDALAREVEGVSRAGETGRARELADLYVERYPSGRRLRSVRRFGGLD